MDARKSNGQASIIYWNSHSATDTTHLIPFLSPVPTPSPILSSHPLSTVSPLTSGNNQPTIRNGSKKRRACNECKQQKLRCDLSTMVQRTSQPCSRCRRLRLECKIDEGFKRKRKRLRSDELEREVCTLRQELERKVGVERAVVYESSGDGQDGQPRNDGRVGDGGNLREIASDVPRHEDLSFITASMLSSPGSIRTSESLSTMTTLFSDCPPQDPIIITETGDQINFTPRTPRTLNDIHLSADEIDVLFEEYFRNYHPFLPFLNPGQSPAQYYHSSPLLFWAVISAASRRYQPDASLILRLKQPVTSLAWTNIQSVSHHSISLIQALTILCAWPYPVSDLKEDPSYLWAGCMVQIGLQMGLDRPRDSMDERVQGEEEVYNQAEIWAACRIVAQSVNIANGLPSPLPYPWHLPYHSTNDSSSPQNLNPNLSLHLRISTFVTTVSHTMSSHSSGLLPTASRLPLYTHFTTQLSTLEPTISPIPNIYRSYLNAARLHLDAFVLFDDPFSPSYSSRVLGLYFTATSLLRHALGRLLWDPESRNPSPMHCPLFLQKAFICAAFVLLRILKCGYFSAFVDAEGGGKLLLEAVEALKLVSITGNDRPAQMAHVLAALWQDQTIRLGSGTGIEGLRLGDHSRGSMSVVFDTLAHWREGPVSQLHRGGGFGHDSSDDCALPDAPTTIAQTSPYEANSLLFDTGNLEFGLDGINFNLIPC